MKTLVPLLVFSLLSTALFGAWSWLRPASGGSSAGWPASMPAFASGTSASAYELKAGGSFVCTTVPGGRDEALARVCAAFAEAGWSAAPIRARDMLMFTRGDAVAAVLAEEVASGTRITAIQRPRGL